MGLSSLSWIVLAGSVCNSIGFAFYHYGSYRSYHW